MKKYLHISCLVILCLIAYGCQKNDVDPTDVDPKQVAPVAKAPADTTIKLPVSALTVKGSGTDASGTIVGYLWSQVSGPAEATITNESSASTSIAGFIAGKYVFQFTVIDNNGLSGLTTFSVTVIAPQITTLTLSPANNPSEVALAVLGSADWTNTTSIEEPLAAWTDGGTPFYVRDLLKFDLSSIPTNSTILTANLYLYSDTIPKNGDLVHANSGIDNSVLIQQVASSWTTATVNWFNQPQGLTANQVVVPGTTLPFLNINVDVKNMVGSMVSTNANYGFKLALQSEVIYTSRIFCSSFYTDASRHPKLVVTYIKN